MQISGETSLWLFKTDINKDSDMSQHVEGQFVQKNKTKQNRKLKQRMETIPDV